MKNHLFLTTCISTVFFLCCVTRADDIPPLREAQEKIAPLFDLKLYSDKDHSVARQKYESLYQPFLDSVGNNRIEAVRQGFCHVQRECTEGRGDMDHTIGMHVLLRRMQITRQELVIAAAPYLDTKDACLREILYKFLLRNEKTTGEGANHAETDFSVYTDLLKSSIAKHEEPSIGIMSYVYQLEPGPAVLQMTAIDEDLAAIRKLLSVAHPDKTPLYWLPPKRNAELRFQSEWDTKALKAEFERLSKSEKWWVRLWVVEALKQLPLLKGNAILESLKTDSNEHIRDRIMKPDPIPLAYWPPPEERTANPTQSK